MNKTAINAVALQHEDLSLRCWLLSRMLYMSPMNRFRVPKSLATRHNKHRKHDYPIIFSCDISHNFSSPKRTTGALKITQG